MGVAVTTLLIVAMAPIWFVVGWLSRGLRDRTIQRRRNWALARAMVETMSRLTGFSLGADGLCDCASCTKQRAEERGVN